jgi:hypothetical protein
MAIALTELPSAVETYLKNSVTSTVGVVTPDTPGTMNPNEFGTFQVSVANAPAPTGVRLTSVKHHLRIEPSNRGLLQVPATPPARATTDPTDPVLAVGSLVGEMFLYPLDSVLEVGDTDVVSGLRVKALGLGQVTITCHVHAVASVTDLFPVKNSENGERVFTVV